MSKQKILIAIPCIIIAIYLLVCWVTILTTNFGMTLKHTFGFVFFIAIVIMTFLFRHINIPILSIGIYLLLATFNVIAITAEITTSWVSILSIPTPPVQLQSLMIFIIYFVLNLDSLITIYLDYKDGKENKV